MIDNRPAETVEHPHAERKTRDQPPTGGPRRDRGRVLIIVQNLSVPFDRRVWLECLSLTDAGFRVAVVCPKAPGDPSYATAQRSRALQVPTVCSRRLTDVLRRRISLLLFRHPRAQPQSKPAGSLRHRPKLQSTGSLLAHRTPVPAASRFFFRLRPPRSLPRAVPIEIPERQSTRLPGPAAHGAMHDENGRPRDLHQRLLSTDRHGARRRRRGERHCCPHRPRHCEDASDDG